MFSRNWTLNETTYEWSSPTGQTYEYSVGFLTAKEVYLKELGWITLTVVKRRAQWLKHQNKSEEWLYFSHPISKKIYMYLEAEDIAFDHHNDDTSYESSLSTKQINASLHFLLPLDDGRHYAQLQPSRETPNRGGNGALWQFWQLRLATASGRATTPARIYAWKHCQQYADAGLRQSAADVPVGSGIQSERV
jgi:hypothetical protein